MKYSRVLARRTLQERHVIACLRGDAARFPIAPDAHAALQALAQAARDRGVTLFAKESPFVGEGELEIVASLAAAQRHAPRAPMTGDSGEQLDALSRCAVMLRQSGLWLPASAPSHMPGRREAGQACPSYHAASLRNRAVSLARATDIASTGAFAAAGVSRQYLSRLCKDGYLQRVRHGWYRATPDPAAAGGSGRYPSP